MKCKSVDVLQIFEVHPLMHVRNNEDTYEYEMPIAYLLSYVNAKSNEI